MRSLVISKMGSYYVLTYIDSTNINNLIIETRRKELAKIIDIGTVKLANELWKFNGIRNDNCFIFQNEDDANKALSWVISKMIANTLSGNKNRPSYGWSK